MIDTHTHVNDKLLRNDAKQIFSTLSENGLELIVENAYDVDSARAAVETSYKYDNVYATVGIHPEYASSVLPDNYQQIAQLARNSKVVAIGEIGLDYHYDGYDKIAQKSVLIKQILIADELKLPIVLHVRDAYEDMESLLSEYRGNINNGVLLHCYSGSAEMLDRFAFLDPYVAFGGAITFKNSKRGDVIRRVKRDRLVAETDCPYLSPTPFRGKINNPSNVRYVIERLAQELEMSFSECERVTSDNAKTFYRIDK